jgi:autotransporter-associated beta strand protein
MKATCLFGASAALAILSFSHLEAPAQEVWVWDGGSSSDSKLSTAENWVSNIQPNTGNDVELQFTGSQRTSPANDFPFETAFWCWHLLPDAGTPFSISGGTVRLSAITNESPHLFTIKSSIHIPQHLQISLQGGDILLGGSEVTFQDSLRDLTVYGSPGGARTLTMGARLMDSASQARLVVNGNATVILTNANVYGDTVINSGRVQVGNGGACGVIGRGNVQVKNNSVLSFNRSDDLHLTTAITGNTAFQMTQDGTGETWLEGGGNNTWAGAVVNAGTLVLAKSSDSSIHALNSASLVKAGGTLRLGGEGNDQIADTATVTLEGGMFDLAGMHEVIAGLSGAGTVDTTQPEVACNFRVGYNSTSSTFSGQIRNSGVNSTLNLEKTGMGTFTLADFVSPFRGTVSVLQGTLALQNGASLPNVPSISLAANTRLKFTGASGIPVGQVVSGLGTIEGAPVIAGKLTPGNGIGVLRFSGTPNLQGTLEMEIRSDGATDKVISDSLLQYGGTLRVVNSGAAFSGGDSIDLFDAPSFGGFASVAAGGAELVAGAFDGFRRPGGESRAGRGGFCGRSNAGVDGEDSRAEPRHRLDR